MVLVQRPREAPADAHAHAHDCSLITVQLGGDAPRHSLSVMAAHQGKYLPHGNVRPKKTRPPLTIGGGGLWWAGAPRVGPRGGGESRHSVVKPTSST
jgi:hypothetical protein